jgi:rSAM/selenodomain-associated transferase 2
MTGKPISSGLGGPQEEPSLTLAVVIPTLNEEPVLPGLLASLRSQSRPAERIIVAEGGSKDGTASIAHQAGAEVVVASNRGRGGQVAAALAKATEDVVLVAHADMVLPSQALESVHRSLAIRSDSPGGCLGHRFDQTSLVLRIIEWCDRRRARRGDSYGDQAQFFRRQALQSVGGFPDQLIMEDVELSRRLRLLGIPLYLDVPVTVSARRFVHEAWWKVLWRNRSLRRRYRREGHAACVELYQRYYH